MLPDISDVTNTSKRFCWRRKMQFGDNAQCCNHHLVGLIMSYKLGWIYLLLANAMHKEGHCQKRRWNCSAINNYSCFFLTHFVTTNWNLNFSGATFYVAIFVSSFWSICIIFEAITKQNVNIKLERWHIAHSARHAVWIVVRRSSTEKPAFHSLQSVLVTSCWSVPGIASAPS